MTAPLTSVKTKYFSVESKTFLYMLLISVVITILATAYLSKWIYIASIPKRKRIIPEHCERVLILGASSGIGATLARKYSARGAAVCLVGRNEERLNAVAQECRVLASNFRWKGCKGSAQQKDVPVLVWCADITDRLRMIALQDQLCLQWNGLDTLVVCAGVSATQPLLSIAGFQHDGQAFITNNYADGIERAMKVASVAIEGNFYGPLTSAYVFIPTLSDTSRSPSILLVSSIASLIPAPTRALYAATKAASLLLYQCLAIEHSNIAFTFVLPSTIEGGFRAKAIDIDYSLPQDSAETAGLSREKVAARCINAIDRGEKNVFIKGYFRYAHLLYWIWPSFIEHKARQKYNYKSFHQASDIILKKEEADPPRYVIQ